MAWIKLVRDGLDVVGVDHVPLIVGEVFEESFDILFVASDHVGGWVYACIRKVM